MELGIGLTVRPAPEDLTRVVVLIITIITVLVISPTRYWRGTAIPTVLSAGLAVAHACGTLLRAPTSAHLPGLAQGPPAGTR